MNGNDCESHPVFIYGHGKSGTTLMLSILDGHPSTLVYPIETYFFGRFMLKTLDLPEDERIEHALCYIKAQYIRKREYFRNLPFRLLADCFRKRLAKSSGEYKDFLCSIVLAFGDATGIISEKTRYWVEKPPEYEKYAKYVFSEWPKAKCIHMIRDPRDNYNSYKKWRELGWPSGSTVNIEWFARRWRKSARFARINQKRFGDKSYLVMKYEDLVQSPDEKIRSIAEFLNIDDHRALRFPSFNGKLWKGNSIHSSAFSGVGPSSVGRWRTQLGSRSAARLEILLRPEMKKFGYEPETSVRSRIQLAAIKFRYTEDFSNKIRNILYRNPYCEY